MNKLVIIGANDFQNRLILKAKSLGYETHVFAWKDGSIGEQTADFFYPISIIEKDQILEKCREINPVGVCTIASDLAANTVTYVAQNLGLCSNTIESIEKCSNKYSMRKALEQADVCVPKYYKASSIHDVDLENIEFPIIVKPTDRSGSRGITKLFTTDGLNEAIERAKKDSFENKAIVEEYFEGNEYSAECISYKSKHRLLAVTKKYTTGSPNYIETAHCEPSDLSGKIIEKIKNELFKALDALEIQYGASHPEFKVDSDGNVKIIEIGARMGGDCIGSDLVPLSTGYDFVKMVIDVACGEEPDFTIKPHYKNVWIKFIFNESDIQDMEAFVNNYKDQIIRISDMELENIGKTVDSSSRIGYYIFVDVHCEQGGCK